MYHNVITNLHHNQHLGFQLKNQDIFSNNDAKGFFGSNQN